ncbi:MAG TPA: site-specific DNA-methyltransferase [Candidatus Atribacteria bacterium]|nr:site-specific DNA-methyltransferase [Candidatus Atribacteria bacterium]
MLDSNIIENTIIRGNALDILLKLPSEAVNCCVTSPPYWSLRDYGIEPVIWDGDKNCKHIWGNKTLTLKHKSGETNPGKESWFKDRGASNDIGNCFCLKCGAWKGSLGLEPTFELYIKHLCDIFDEVKRVLRKDGTCWINLGDSYGGNQGKYNGWPDQKLTCNEMIPNRKVPINVPSKSLCLIPQRFAIEMVNRGWILRNVIIWHKPNCMPSSVKDRFTVDFEYVYFFVKSNKPIFWTNEKTLERVDKKPPGIKGIEGKDWEWREVGNYEGTDVFNVRVRDSHKDKYLDKVSSSEIALKYGYDPEGICPVCGRTWKRHANPNAKDRKEGIRNEFIPCIKNTKIPEGQAENFGSPRGRNYRKAKIKKVSLWTGHDYWFEQQFEPLKESSILRAKYNSYSLKTDTGIRGGMNLENQRKAFNKMLNLENKRANKRAVWTISTRSFKEAHFATFPESLVEPMIQAGCPKGGIVLDPFMGAGTTALAALKQRKKFIGIELKQEYINMAKKRIKQVQPNLF